MALELESEFKENMEPRHQNGDEDTHSWVLDALRGMSLEFKPDNLTEKNAVFNLLHSLIIEKNRWQSHCSSLADENGKINHQFLMSQKEHERNLIAINSLRCEVAVANNKVAAVMVEQREVKAHWLAEKSELESRVFQSQALATQWQGSLRKKEKDYDKLHIQLSKLMKESSRGQKDAIAKIVISKPLAKNLTQTKPNCSLKDAEMAAAQETIAMLEKENLTFRKAIDDLTTSINDLKDKFTADLEKLENQQLLDKQKMMELAIKTAEQQNSQLIKDRALLSTSSPQTESSSSSSFPPLANTPPTIIEAEAAVMVSESLKKTRTTHFQSPNDGRNLIGLESTPVVRPAVWVVEQANTELKNLRNRADGLARNGGLCDIITENIPAVKYETMRAQLIEALAVIHEQDRLIHEALLGRLPGRILEFVSKNETENLWEDEDGEDDAEVKEMSRKKEDGICGGAASSMSPFPGCDDEDIFPTASPATMALVKGWFKTKI